MPATRTPARPTTPRSVVVTLACVGLLAAITTIAHRYAFSTLDLDRGAILSWLHGDGLYAYRDPATQLGTALSPAAALLTAPAAFLPLTVAGWLLALAGVAALSLALIAHAAPIALHHGRRPWPVVLATGALALTIEPVRATIGLGTLDLLAFGLVTADLIALRNARSPRARVPAGTASGRTNVLSAWRVGDGRARGDGQGCGERGLVGWGRRVVAGGGWAGAGVGLAAALSVGSVFFIGYLVVSRQRKAALVAAGTAVGTLLVPLAVSPYESGVWFGDVLWRIDRAGPVEAIGNQSLAGVLARLYDSSATPVLLWLSFAVLITAVGMIRARAAHADGDEVAAFSLVGLTAAIAGPVSGTHELLWVLPAMLVLADVAAGQRTGARRTAVAGAGVYLLFVLAPMWSLPGPVAVNSFALALILLLNTMPWRQPPPRIRGS